jgi:hypothetical protein
VLLPGYLSLAVAAVLGPSSADTETGPKPVQVEFDAPEGCSGAEPFFNTLRSRTDRVRRAEGNEPRTTLQVRLTRGHGQVVGELRMVDDHGGTDTRKVQGASCDDVVQALSLTAALAVDPSALLFAPATSPAPVESAPATPAAPPNAPVVEHPLAATSNADSRPLRRLVPTVEFGFAPIATTVLSGSYSPGVTLAVRRTLAGDGAFRPTLGLAIAYVRNDVFESPQAAQVSLAGLAGTVCPLRWTASILTLQPCALVLAGWLSASGRRMTHSDTANRLWLSAGGVVRTTAFMGRGVSLELEAGISAPVFKRKFFATTPSNVMAETPTISPLVGIGLTFAL